MDQEGGRLGPRRVGSVRLPMVLDHLPEVGARGDTVLPMKPGSYGGFSLVMGTG